VCLVTNQGYGKNMAVNIWTIKLEYREEIAENYWRFGFDRGMEFLPGQYVSVKVDETGIRRSYSIVSGVREKLELLIDVSPMGVGSKYFLSLKVGDSVEVMGPLGKFVVEKEDRNAVMIATGSGIAPMRPMAESLIGKSGVKIRLYWGVRFEKNLFWLDRFEEWKRKGNFEYKIAVSKPENGESKHVQEVIEIDKEARYYLCGSQRMVVEVTEWLKDRGIDEGNIKSERYD
jgi:ferredoxin--NADP+ reductase